MAGYTYGGYYGTTNPYAFNAANLDFGSTVSTPQIPQVNLAGGSNVGSAAAAATSAASGVADAATDGFGGNFLWGAGDEVGLLGNQSQGVNMKGVNLALGGIEALGNMWMSYQSHKLAKQSFALQEESYRTSLADNRQTYNTALEDRIRSRYAAEGRSDAEADSYIAENSLG